MKGNKPMQDAPMGRYNVYKMFQSWGRPASEMVIDMVVKRLEEGKATTVAGLTIRSSSEGRRFCVNRAKKHKKSLTV